MGRGVRLAAALCLLAATYQKCKTGQWRVQQHAACSMPQPSLTRVLLLPLDGLALNLGDAAKGNLLRQREGRQAGGTASAPLPWQADCEPAAPGQAGTALGGVGVAAAMVTVTGQASRHQVRKPAGAPEWTPRCPPTAAAAQP